MEGSIADVRCPNCGAPARFDILTQNYHCAHCGGRVEVSEALRQKQGFRRLQQQRIKESAARLHLMRTSCTGCGAEVVFEESEALSTCSFCGRALVRGEYLASDEMPEMILPFRLTRQEAAECLSRWCAANVGKTEAKTLQGSADQLQGFYLPYELLRGPVTSRVRRMDANRSYQCRGYVDEIFVNCSDGLDNLLLDGMEPFDFSYAAGQRIKIGDVSAAALKQRIDEELASDYAPVVRKTMKTKAVDVATDPESVLRLPVLLPVYYLRAGETMAAVNGQTGKVSVRAAKESHFYFLPWWLKAILATLIISGTALGGFRLFGMETSESLLIGGILAFLMLIITLCAYSDTVQNPFRVETRRKIFTSRGGPLRREGSTLVQAKQELRKSVMQPVFFEPVKGREQPVCLVFSSPRRILRLAALSLAALFLPVMIALLLNGFDFGRLTLGGSAAWFCIMVPVIPIYILKFAVIELYERPWVYLLQENGRTKRVREKHSIGIDAKTVLRLLFVPPASLAVWFGLLCFGVMCWLTAFGFD